MENFEDADHGGDGKGHHGIMSNPIWLRVFRIGVLPVRRHYDHAEISSWKKKNYKWPQFGDSVITFVRFYKIFK